MIIRKATKYDLSTIAENNIKLAKETEGRIIEKNIAKKGSKEVFSNSENGFYLVAEQDNDIIGHLFITEEWSDWRNKAIWWIHRVYVRGSFRDKGVLTKLLEKVKELASMENVFALRLYVTESNKKALTIYKKLGFTDTSFIILEQQHFS